jgi:hypothetical protein
MPGKNCSAGINSKTREKETAEMRRLHICDYFLWLRKRGDGGSFLHVVRVAVTPPPPPGCHGEEYRTKAEGSVGGRG